MSGAYGETGAGWKKPVNPHQEAQAMAHIPSRQTYIEVKVTSEQWWLLLFNVWLTIALGLVTNAIIHNVTVGWHCPRNCDAFLTPFAVSIATFVVPLCFCCPVMGAKGV